ncbi:DUF4360 domain-containing protein [Streptomyces sp. NPDC006459]|uniref:DUF4360 domain-containing protein n=1 Tax=Streptomyces sp. NPDC006459 TaxID=3154303 RepID=UPI0033BB8E1A
MSRLIAVAGFTAALMAASSISPSSAAQRTPLATPPERITIDLVNVNGSGCPAGSAQVAVSPDNTAFTVTYSQYLAQAGRGAKPTDFRKNCQIALNVHVPQGFTYAIAQADYRGFAHLERGATGLQRANYYFQGMPQTTFVNHGLAGPMDDSWQNTDTTAVESLVFAPCGAQRYFNINTELRVNAGNSDPNKSSFISMDSTDASINTLYHFAWKKCP